MKNKIIEDLKKAIAAAPIDPDTGAVSPTLANYCDCLYTQLGKGVSVDAAHNKCKSLGLYSQYMCPNVKFMRQLGLCRLMCGRRNQAGSLEFNKCVQKCMTNIDKLAPDAS